MKNSFFVLLLAFLLSHNVARANGASTVLFTVLPDSYFLTAAAEDPDFGFSDLSSVFNQASKNLFIARVDHDIYRSAAFLHAKGYEVVLGFDEYKNVRFKYIPELRNFVGVTPEENVILVLEKVRTQGKGPGKDAREDCDGMKKPRLPRH